jgi:hypothetical protein
MVRVTNPEEAPATWRFELETTIGQVGTDRSDEPDVFGSITSIVTDDSARIYVADGQTQEIKVFRDSGQHLFSFGRRGEGPGEFGYVNSLLWMADTLYVLDPGNARIQRFVGEGVDAGSIRWLPYTGAPDLIRFYPASDGLLHVPTLPPILEGSGYLRGRAFLSYSGQAVVDSIFVPFDQSPPPAGITCRTPTSITFWTSPLNERELSAPAATGLAWHFRTSDYELNLVTAMGDTIRQITREGANRPVTDLVWRQVEDSVRAFRSRQSADAVCEPLTLPRPNAMPVVAAVYYDADGALIVETEVDDGYAFDFYDDEGRLVATAAAPPRDRRLPPHFEADRLYVATRGDFEVPGVAVYRFIRPE